MMDLEITLRVNGAAHRLSVDTHTTLLGVLRSASRGRAAQHTGHRGGVWAGRRG